VGIRGVGMVIRQGSLWSTASGHVQCFRYTTKRN